MLQVIPTPFLTVDPYLLSTSVVPIDKPNNLPAAVEYWKAIGEAVDLPFYIYWMANTADKAVTPEQVAEKVAASGSISATTHLPHRSPPHVVSAGNDAGAQFSWLQVH